MRDLKQSTARNLSVFMTDNTDHVTGKTGLTLTIRASKDGAAFSVITPTVTELDYGWYSLALTTSDTDTLGDLALHITSAGADPTDLLSQVVGDFSLGAIRRNVAIPGFQFAMFDTDGNPALDLTGISAKVSLDGAAFTDCANSPTEIGNGWYTIDLDAAETDGKTMAFKFTALGAKPTFFTTIAET